MVLSSSRAFALLAWVGVMGVILGPSIEAKLPQGLDGVVTIIAHLSFVVVLAIFTSFFYQPKGQVLVVSSIDNP